MPQSRWNVIIGFVSLFVLTGFADQPVKHDRSYYETRGDIVWEVPTAEKRIALTFDDGPNPQTTPQVLDLLKQYGAKATFFVVGFRLDKYPDVVKREVAEGHEVANHTKNHVYFKGTVSKQRIAAEIGNMQQKIQAVTQQNCPWFRPPGGYYNDEVVRVAKQYGYTVVLWSWHQDTKDWSVPGVDKIVDKVLGNARNGDIVLLHDHVGGSTQTVEALAIILPELQKRGFRVVTVSELMEYRQAKK